MASDVIARVFSSQAKWLIMRATWRLFELSEPKTYLNKYFSSLSPAKERIATSKPAAVWSAIIQTAVVGESGALLLAFISQTPEKSARLWATASADDST